MEVSSTGAWPVVEVHETARWIRSAAPAAPVRVVDSTWPSDVNIPYLLPLDVNILGQRSGNYGFHLAHLVGQLKPEQPVTLVGHSHGARLTAATMHLLGGGSIEGERLPAEKNGGSLEDPDGPRLRGCRQKLVESRAIVRTGASPCRRVS